MEKQIARRPPHRAKRVRPQTKERTFRSIEIIVNGKAKKFDFGDLTTRLETLRF